MWHQDARIRDSRLESAHNTMAATSQPDSTMDSIRDGRRDTEHGARSTFKHSASDRGSVSLAHTYPHEVRQKLLVPHTRTQSPEPGETVNPLPEYIYAVAHRVPRARGGQRISPRESALRLSVNAYGLRVVSGSPHHDWHRDRSLCLPRALPVAKQALSAYPQQTRVQQGYTAGVTEQSVSPGFPPVQCASRHLYIHCDKNHMRFSKKKPIHLCTSLTKAVCIGNARSPKATVSPRQYSRATARLGSYPTQHWTQTLVYRQRHWQFRLWVPFSTVDNGTVSHQSSTFCGLRTMIHIDGNNSEADDTGGDWETLGPLPLYSKCALLHSLTMD